MSNSVAIGSKFLRMPQDVLGEVLSLVPIKELALCKTFATCKAFKELAKRVYDFSLRKMTTMDCADVFRNFHNASLRRPVDPVITNLEVLLEANRATRVVFTRWHTDIPQAFAAYFASPNASRLTSIEFNDPLNDIAQATLSMVERRCPQLRELTLLGRDEDNLLSCDLERGDESIQELLNMRRLQSLTIYCGNITNSVMGTLVKMRSLTEINFGLCSQISCSGIATLLQDAPRLCSLGIHGYTGIAFLGHLHHDENEMWPVKAVVEHGRNLTSLNLSNHTCDPDDVMAIVTRCTKLTHLDLTDSDVVFRRGVEEFAKRIYQANPKLTVVGFKTYPLISETLIAHQPEFVAAEVTGGFTFELIKLIADYDHVPAKAKS